MSDEGEEQLDCELEGQSRRRAIYGLMNSSISFGRFMHKLWPGGQHRALRKVVRLSGGVMRKKVAGISHTRALVCGTHKVSIYKHVAKSGPQPLIVFMHGGGWVFGSARSYHGFTIDLCRDTGAIVVSVDYRLAPEHPYPAGLDDCLAVARAVLQADVRPEQLPCELRDDSVIDVNRVFLAGDSAGGNFAACIALEMIRCDDKRRPSAIVLINPSLQAVTQAYPSYRKLERYTRDMKNLEMMNFVLCRYAGFEPTGAQMKLVGRGGHVPDDETRQQLIANYLTSPQSKIEPKEQNSLAERNLQEEFLPRSVTDLALCVRAWPLLAEDGELAQMPTTFVQVCSEDALRDEGLVFAERMRHAGARDVRLSQVANGEHVEAVLSKMIRTEAGNVAYREIVTFFQEHN